MMTSLPLLLLFHFIYCCCWCTKPILGFSFSSIILSSPTTTTTTTTNTRRYAIDEISSQPADKDHPLAETSRLSHVMLRVPSVDDTVKYWTTIQGGSIRVSSSSSSSSQELSSAMIELGCHDDDVNPKGSCFALEFVTTTKKKKDFSMGNVLSYIGVSMLLAMKQGKNPIEMMMMMSSEDDDDDNDEESQKEEKEPNGIIIQSSASAPGDYFARLALLSNNLDKTQSFYTSILGMDTKARDDKMLCLRYDNKRFSGVQTTLLFTTQQQQQQDLDMGDCFDHFVIGTKTNIQELYSSLLLNDDDNDNDDVKIFMKPTQMFGRDVMGLLDPNGYKVILASD